MPKFSRMPVRILFLVLVATICYGQDRAFLFPTGGSNTVTVLDAADLSPVGAIPATSTAFRLLATPRGDRYYIFSRTSTDAIVVVDARNLAVLRRISLGVGVSDAVLTPDGDHLIVAAGQLHLYSTSTDEIAATPIDVGGGPTQLSVNQRSTRAYVLSAAGREIHVIDVPTFSETTFIETPTLSSITLLESANRLVGLDGDGVRVYDVETNEEVATIDSLSAITNGILFPVPGTTKVAAHNRGSAPNNTSQLFDVVSRTVTSIGIPASFGLRDLLIVNSEKAFAILDAQSDVAEIDLTQSPTAPVTPLNLGVVARNLSRSPSGRHLFISSLSESRFIRFDTEALTPTHDIDLALSPSGNGVAYAPSSKPPAIFLPLSGQNQFLPPGATTRSPLSVQVLDEDSTPLFNIPVVFASPLSDEVVFDAAQPVRTNADGVASVNAMILASGAPQGQPLSAGDTVGATAAPQTPPLPTSLPKGGTTQPIEPVPVTATTSGGLSTVFVLNIIRVTGIHIAGGNFQVAEPRKSFPDPFVVLATDEMGNPLPGGTEVIFTPAGANCPTIVAPVDDRGFAQIECVASEIPLGVSTFLEGTMAASVLNNIGLGVVTFDFTVSVAANSIEMDIVSGNNQTGRTSEPLDTPLVFALTAPFGGIGQSLIGVEIEQIVGSGAVITPSFLPVARNVANPISVILGPAAGPVVIRARALTPETPSVDFMIDAIGGVPTSFQKVGDQQSGRIGRTLLNPLRLRVRNELGEVIAFPIVDWTVMSGEASLLTASDPDGATATVSLGNTPGQIVIRATIGSLVATFNVTATPPQVAMILPIQGTGQILQVGMTSEPLIAEVREPDGQAAFGAFIDFSGPAHVELISAADAQAIGNPLRLRADEIGQAGVLVRLLSIPITATKGEMGNVTITASVGGGPLTTFPIAVIGRDPAFETAGVVNAATFGSGVVPGSLATIFGVGLSEGVVGTLPAEGATTFAGATVKFGGVEAPLLTITNDNGVEQLNLQVPFGIPTGQTTTVEVDNNGSSFSVAGVPVFSTQPGVFEVPLGGGITGGAVTDALTFQLITPGNPAALGQAVSVFYTGGGVIGPSVGTGVPGPVPPSETTLLAEVFVDGVAAEVLFSGYAPGFLGLYQINFVIPEGTNCGTRSLVVRVGGSGSPVSTVNLACP